MTEKPIQTRIGRLNYIIEKLRQFGMKDSSRLMRMKEVLERGYIAPDDPDLQIALESMRDIHQLGLIVDTMESSRGDAEFRQNLKHLPHDEVLPQDEQNTPGRDFQFQLYIAALCLNAGLKVKYGKSDVTCIVNGSTYVIEAKRVKGYKKLLGRVAEAAMQILEAGIPGIIAIDLTIPRTKDIKLTTSRLLDGIHEMEADQRKERYFQEHENQLLDCVKGTGTLAVLVFESVVKRPQYKDREHIVTRLWFHTTNGGLNAEKQLKELKVALKKCPNMNFTDHDIDLDES